MCDKENVASLIEDFPGLALGTPAKEEGAFVKVLADAGLPQVGMGTH